MRDKKRFIFNEKKDAEKTIEEGFLDGVLDYRKIYTVAKHLREEYGYGEKRLEEEIIGFCKKYDKNFNPITEGNTIHRWVKSAMNYGLRKIEEVEISEKDIEFLKTIKVLRDRKILFITLVFSKSLKQASTKKKKKEKSLSDNYYIHYNNLLDVAYLTEISNLTETGLVKTYYKYPQYISFLHPERELIKLEYVDKELEKKIIIDNLDNMIKHYEKLFETPEKHSIKNCVTCGKELNKSSNRQKMCPECSVEKRKENQKHLMRKRRQRK